MKIPKMSVSPEFRIVPLDLIGLAKIQSFGNKADSSAFLAHDIYHGRTRQHHSALSINHKTSFTPIILIMNNTLIWKESEELLSRQRKETTPLVEKLNAFTERVRGDIEKNLIGKADGQKLIAKATIVISILTTT
ncbi:MAG: hypothetical protein Q8940_22370 [Bacteroidota bacterium]|nr:hypothetical protein [Bacteroidota bacterium]